MRKPSENPSGKISLREKIMGLGDSSLKKNYYKQLQEEIESLEKSRESLEKAIQRAEANENLFRALFDNAIDGIVLIDIETKKLSLCNRAMLSMLGYDSMPEDGLSIQQIHPEMDFPRVFEQYERIIKGETKLIRNIPVTKKSSSLIYVDIGGTPIEWDGKNTVIGIFRDMTEARRLAIERKELESRLYHMQKMEAIGTLAGEVAHDFNNTLAAIMGLAQLSLISEEGNPELCKRLEQIMNSCYRARDLTSQLFSISYRNEKILVPVNLVPVIKDAVKLIRATIPSTVSIQTFIDVELDTALADQTQIIQIIMSLCTNAAQAIPEMKGEIIIRARDRFVSRQFTSTHPELEEGWHMIIEVSDNGCGIKPENIERIFEPFFTTRERGKGTGLGLSVLHGIVKNHGGSVFVESEEGYGTTFQVYIPLTSDRQVPVSAQDEVPVPAVTVLFIDDERILTQINSMLLESMGHKVITFTNAMEALRYFRSEPQSVDIVITDMTMPHMTGLALSEEIHVIRPDIPVILCSGYNEQLMEEKIESSGISEILMKPYNTIELSRSLRRALKNK